MVETAIEEETLQALLSLVLQKAFVLLLLCIGLAPNHQAKDGATPAHFAAASGQVSETILCTTHRVH